MSLFASNSSQNEKPSNQAGGTTNPNGQSSGLFGSMTNPPGQNKSAANLNEASTSLFAKTTNPLVNPNEKPSSLFGNAPAQSSNGADLNKRPTSMLGSIPRPTKDLSYDTLQTKDMKEFEKLSLEELRTADYNLIKKADALPSELKQALDVRLQGSSIISSQNPDPSSKLETTLTKEQQEALEKELALKKQKELEEEQKTAQEKQARRRQNLQDQKTLSDQVLPDSLLLSYDSFTLKEERNFTVTYQATAIEDRNQHVIVTALNLKPATKEGEQENQRHCYELFLKTTMRMLSFNHDLICPIIDYDFELATTRAYFVQPMYSKSLRDMIDTGEKIDIQHLLTNLQSLCKYIESKDAVFGTLDPSTIYWHKGNYCLTQVYYWKDIFTFKKCLDLRPLISMSDPEDALAAEEEKLVNEENEFKSKIKTKRLLMNKKLREIIAPDLSWSKNCPIRTEDSNEVYSLKEIENIQRQQVGLLILRVLGISNTVEKFLLESKANTNYRIILGGVLLELLEAKGLMYLLKPLASMLELDSNAYLSTGIRNILKKDLEEKTQRMVAKASKIQGGVFQIDSESYCLRTEQTQSFFLAVCRNSLFGSAIELWHNGRTPVSYLLQNQAKYSMLVQIPETSCVWAYTGRGFDLVDIPQQKTLYRLDSPILQDIELDTVCIGSNYNIAMSKRKQLTVYNYALDRYDTISVTCDSFDLNYLGDKVAVLMGSSLHLVEAISNKELKCRNLEHASTSPSPVQGNIPFAYNGGLFGGSTRSSQRSVGIVRWSKTIPVIALAYDGTVELMDQTTLECLKKLPDYNVSFMSWSPYIDHLYTIQVFGKATMIKFGGFYNNIKGITSLDYDLDIQEIGFAGKIKSISWPKSNEIPLFINYKNQIFDVSIDSSLAKDAEILSCCYVKLPIIPIH